jgi:hypothetical protein
MGGSETLVAVTLLLDAGDSERERPISRTTTGSLPGTHLMKKFDILKNSALRLQLKQHQDSKTPLKRKQPMRTHGPL